MSRTPLALNSLNDSAQSPPKSTNAFPAAAFASCACNDRASPANTKGGRLAISASAFESSSSSSYFGCCSASRARHDDGVQSARDAPVAEICFAPRSADSYSASGDGAEPGEITALRKRRTDGQCM